jgi:hypothetical protein
MLRRPPESALRTAVGVVHDPCRWLSSGDGHGQGVDDELGVTAGAHGPPDDAAGAEVEHAGEVETSVVGVELGEVGHPPLVWELGTEVSLEQVRGRCTRPILASSPAPSVRESRQTGSAHQPADAFVVHAVATTMQLPGNRGRP